MSSNIEDNLEQQKQPEVMEQPLPETVEQPPLETIEQPQEDEPKKEEPSVATEETLSEVSTRDATSEANPEKTEQDKLRELLLQEEADALAAEEEEQAENDGQDEEENDAMGSAPIKNNLQSKFKQWIDTNVKKKLMPCGEVIISRNGKIVCEYKNVNKRKASIQVLGLKGTPDAQHSGNDQLYRLYSMTKPVITAVAMILHDDGALDLNAPVSQYLGDAWKMENMRVIDSVACAGLPDDAEPITVPCTVQMTVKHLLTHTSGLSHGLAVKPNLVDKYYKRMGIDTQTTTELNPFKHGLPSLDKFLDIISKCPLLFQPGTSWEYSYSLELVTKIIEILAAKQNFSSVNEFMIARLCKPLDMHDTTFFPNAEQNRRLAPIYIEKGPTLVYIPARFPTYEMGSAALFASMHDYFKFASMLSRGGLGLNGTRVLSEDTVKMMRTNQLVDADGKPCSMEDISKDIWLIDKPKEYGFGYGGSLCLVDDKTSVSRLGEYSWSGATQTTFFIDPQVNEVDDELIVVFMTAVCVGGTLKVSDEVHRLVYGEDDEAEVAPHGRSSERRRSSWWRF